MPALNSIAADKLARLIGTPSAPVLVDVRGDPGERFLPASLHYPAKTVAHWREALVDRALVVIDEDGETSAQGVAAWLRSDGIAAEALDGGFASWTAANLPLTSIARLPKRDTEGRTAWVTRARPKVDRIACPWLIRRFVDPRARFLFVPPSDVVGVAARFGAAPFDIEGDGIAWSHDGDRCTFDAMLEGFGLADFAPLAHLATIVRGADTGKPDLIPEAAGLVALSLGLSRMFSDDLEQLEAGMLVYDALFRWCRDATNETHDWVSHQPKGARAKGVPA
jgi:rhodanese-related sulfurtransferase